MKSHLSMYNWELITSIYGLKPDPRAGTGFPFYTKQRRKRVQRLTSSMKVSELMQMMLLLNYMNLCVSVSYLY